MIRNRFAMISSHQASVECCRAVAWFPQRDSATAFNEQTTARQRSTSTHSATAFNGQPTAQAILCYSAVLQRDSAVLQRDSVQRAIRATARQRSTSKSQRDSATARQRDSATAFNTAVGPQLRQQHPQPVHRRGQQLRAVRGAVEHGAERARGAALPWHPVCSTPHAAHYM